jgi:hypothetical protein
MLTRNLQYLGGLFSQSTSPVFLEVLEHHTVAHKLFDEQ